MFKIEKELLLIDHPFCSSDSYLMAGSYIPMVNMIYQFVSEFKKKKKNFLKTQLNANYL